MVGNNAQGQGKAQEGNAAPSTHVSKHSQEAGMTHSMPVTVVGLENRTGAGVVLRCPIPRDAI